MSTGGIFATVTSFPGRFMRSLVGKIIILGFIILLLMIPYFMAVGLRRDRMNRSRNAEREVSEKWGGKQLIAAPVLAIGVQTVRKVKRNGNAGQVEYTRSTWHVLPENLSVESSIVPEIRFRGIYQVMLYKAKIRIKAKFADLPGSLPGECKIDEAGQTEILFRLSDVKGIQKLEGKIDGKGVKPLAGKVISFPAAWKKEAKTLEFSAELDLNGCRDLLFLPIGKNFSLSMDSPWPHPSFSGGFLPRERQISEKGFHAEWTVSELNSAFPQSWIGNLNTALPVDNDYMSSSKALGVSLVQPAGVYQQVERVSDYAFLLIAIVLVAFLIGESVTKIWIHPIQYFFAGLALVMFYVLLLALAEHMPFNLSYLLSTLIISGMTVLYCRMIFAEKRSAALLLGGVMLLAYLLIFVLIRLEDYALLAGSGVLLVLLGVLMRVTGNMNKRELTQAQEPGTEPKGE